jgi:hypothetical protein
MPSLQNPAGYRRQKQPVFFYNVHKLYVSRILCFERNCIQQEIVSTFVLALLVIWGWVNIVFSQITALLFEVEEIDLLLRIKA